ncbi:MAG: hypothetical protein OJF49_004743 [Ktedonobacterales bacterium]|nr:MAG: hypothetical protein OJF49_004743 [Ktedonobacterales bacterium]
MEAVRRDAEHGSSSPSPYHFARRSCTLVAHVNETYPRGRIEGVTP